MVRIVLKFQTYKEPDTDELKYDVHFWIGKYSTQVSTEYYRLHGHEGIKNPIYHIVLGGCFRTDGSNIDIYAQRHFGP